MSTKIFQSLVTIIAVLSLMVSGCSAISYAAKPANAAAPTDALIASPQVETDPSTPPSTVQPVTQDDMEAQPLTVDELAGTWFNGSYLSFKSNGAYAVYASLEALQAGDKLDEGQYGMQGDQLWFGPMSRNCNGMGFYKLTDKGQDELEFTKIREECSRSLGKLQRVMP